MDDEMRDDVLGLASDNGKFVTTLVEIVGNEGDVR